jgi:hypothetical protein
MRRLSLFYSRVACRRALVGGCPHLVLGEGQCPGLATFIAPVKKTPAQERQVLYAYAISSRYREIGPNRARSPHPVLAYAIKCEHASSHIVGESGQNKLHHWAPYKAALPLLLLLDWSRHE